jgi:peptide deformylase
MAVLPIVTGAETEMLHKKAKKVKDPLHPDIQKLIKDMFASMHAAEGLGLAAPQINRSLRLCVIEIEGKKMVFINPSLTAQSKDKILFEEGCLSLPGQYFFIERSEKVTVRYQNEKGESCKLKASGLLAVALQHEIDHLEGVLIVDRFKAQKIKAGTKVLERTRPRKTHI